MAFAPFPDSHTIYPLLVPFASPTKPFPFTVSAYENIEIVVLLDGLPEKDQDNYVSTQLAEQDMNLAKLFYKQKIEARIPESKDNHILEEGARVKSLAY